MNDLMQMMQMMEVRMSEQLDRQLGPIKDKLEKLESKILRQRSGSQGQTHTKETEKTATITPTPPPSLPLQNASSQAKTHTKETEKQATHVSLKATVSDQSEDDQELSNQLAKGQLAATIAFSLKE
ncbi:uncharacterized protein KY384_001540 [Bacidia gigantensis]|uniref:uncharacterized protein n=1 Tax=Bacidia gigantensis TaxID=2732470 RepID=UPI001D04CBFD|nr:uncharacterized protein KY384_001540 [Bacidia gigantensis]KAG8533799.1 hypothetical protein KY384_001540 [Bacidia gigantensis]